MNENATPRLGVETVWVKHCTREVGDGFCPKDATVHLLWDDMENVLACDEHFAEARERWSIRDAHEVGSVCSMPGATWSYDEKRCLIEGVDEAEPELIAVAARGVEGSTE